jgi:hypothetical protein
MLTPPPEGHRTMPNQDGEFAKALANTLNGPGTGITAEVIDEITVGVDVAGDGEGRYLLTIEPVDD